LLVGLDRENIEVGGFQGDQHITHDDRLSHPGAVQQHSCIPLIRGLPRPSDDFPHDASRNVPPGFAKG
jgi:hypothetical protein